MKVDAMSRHRLASAGVLLIVPMLLAACVAATQVAVPAAASAAAPATAARPPQPPTAARHPFAIRSPHGVRNDDYYWLRDDTRTSPAVLDYLRAENTYRDRMLAPTMALQEKFYGELIARLQPDESSAPVFDHGWWYETRFTPGQDYAVLTRHQSTGDGAAAAAAQMLLDGPALARGHDFFQIGAAVASPDGHWLAYCVDTVGRRQFTLQVKNLDTGVVLPFAVQNVEPDVAWANDNKTIVYITKDPITLLSVRVFKHLIGQEVSQDVLMYEERDHSYYISLHRAASDAMLFIELSSTRQSEWWYARADDPALALQAVLPREANHLYQVDHGGGDFIVRSNWHAPNFRLMRAPVASSADKRTWRDVVAPRRDVLIESFALFKDFLAVNERSGGLLKLRVHPWSADVAVARDVVLSGDEPAYAMTLVRTPGLSSANAAQRMRYVYTSLTTPDTTFDYDPAQGSRVEMKRERVLGGFATANYATEFVHAPARDGALVPVSIVYRKTTPLNGTAPLYQYGYGSYGYATDPEFRRDWVSLLDRGFVIALAHVRGGEELGRSWYEDGKLLKKRNTFTDFVDVTRFLVREHYGARDKVFAEGRSAGGLLMGAVANIAPQDYRGIIAGVPFVDVVTTMLDASIPLTTGEFDEWGNPEQQTSYDYMLSYSPYDNVSAQRYPAMFVATGLWDSQVQYYEPAKWVAKLRALKTDANPLLLSVDMAAGHGGKSGRFQKYRDTAKEYAFICGLLGITQ